jgi:hypothetical protein
VLKLSTRVFFFYLKKFNKFNILFKFTLKIFSEEPEISPEDKPKTTSGLAPAAKGKTTTFFT